jgi:DNA-3-methyladenine glycosylase I
MTARTPAQILEAVCAIPEGFVRTYGEIWPGSPRLAGRALHGAIGDLPWWRVVRANGSLPLGEDQRARLAAEGVPLLATEPPRVDMRRAHFRGDAHATASGGWRCFGDGDPLYERYHDEEWGFPVMDERGLFERLSLEAFQSGLSWRTILARRDAFRTAFAGFQPDVLAHYGPADVERLLGDASIIRNRAKIQATLANAKATVALRAGGAPLQALVRSHAPKPSRRAPTSLADLPAATPQSTALARELKSRGFRFVGPRTSYALMQACGLVNDHLAGCPVRTAVERAREEAGLI